MRLKIFATIAILLVVSIVVLQTISAEPDGWSNSNNPIYAYLQEWFTSLENLLANKPDFNNESGYITISTNPEPGVVDDTHIHDLGGPSQAVISGEIRVYQSTPDHTVYVQVQISEDGYTWYKVHETIVSSSPADPHLYGFTTTVSTPKYIGVSVFSPAPSHDLVIYYVTWENS